MRKERESWIDCWKGVLILMVVLGHVAGGGCHLSTGAACELLRMVYFLIYAFHMPAFFFLAGWMWRDKPFKDFVTRRFARLMVPYFAVGVISILVYVALEGGREMVAASTSDGYYSSVDASRGIATHLLALVHGGGWPNGQGLRFNTVLWFLPCMYTTMVVYGAIKGMVRGLGGLVGLEGLVGLGGTRGMLAVGAVAFVGGWAMSSSWIRGWFWGVDKVPYYLSFVILGDVMQRVWKGTVLQVKSCLAAVFFVLYGFAVWRVLYGEMYQWFAYPLRFAIALFGIYLSMILARALQGHAQAWLCAAGVSSMTIMLWHKFFVVGAQTKLPFVLSAYRSGLLGAALATAFVTLGATVACMVLAKGWGKVESSVSIC